jgi:hypothetical protein
VLDEGAKRPGGQAKVVEAWCGACAIMIVNWTELSAFEYYPGGANEVDRRVWSPACVHIRAYTHSEILYMFDIGGQSPSTADAIMVDNQIKSTCSEIFSYKQRNEKEKELILLKIRGFLI